MAEPTNEQRLYGRLEQLERERKEAKDQLDRERLVRVTSEVIRTITDPGFVERMRQARAAAEKGAGLDTAAQLLSIEGLRRAGVDIPDDFRLTSRVFEDRVDNFKLEINEVPGPADMPPAWGACAGGGGLSFCGCGGFST